MKGVIDGINFFELEAMKYYSFPRTWEDERKKRIVNEKIFSGSWMGAQKRDGIFMMFVKDDEGNMFFRPRSRNVKKEFVNKIEWVPQFSGFFSAIPKGTCFLGELFLKSDEQAKSASSIMNCLCARAIKRQEKEFLEYYVFDCLAWNGKSLLQSAAKERVECLSEGAQLYDGDYVEWAEYHWGKDLWKNLQELLLQGYEGVVILNENETYRPGKRSNKVSLKIKKELQETIDCVIIGANPPTREYTGKEIETWPYWLNDNTGEKIKCESGMDLIKTYGEYVDGAPLSPITKNYYYGWAGSLKLGLYRDGRMVHVGNLSGITDEVKENWKNYVNKVAEVAAMEIMDNAQGGRGLRHPKLVRFRDDKDPHDCEYKQIM